MKVKCGFLPEAAPSRSLADGHHVDDAGRLIAGANGDVRAPAERWPISTRLARPLTIPAWEGRC